MTAPPSFAPRRLRQQLRPVLCLADAWRKDLRYGVASGILQQVLLIAGGSIAAYAAARAVRGASYDQLSLWLLGLIIVVLPQVRTPWLEALSLQAIANRVEASLRQQVYDQLARLAPAGLAGRRSGELAYTAMDDVSVIRRFYAETLSTLIVAATVPALTLAALAVLSWPIALCVAPFMALAVAVPVWLHARGEHRSGRDELADLSAELVDVVQGLRDTVTFGAQGSVLADLEQRGQRLDRLRAGHDNARAVERLAADLIAVAGPFVVLALGAALAADHQLRPALFPPVVVAAALAFVPVSRLAEAAKALSQVGAAGDRVVALLSRPVPVTDRDVRVTDKDDLASDRDDLVSDGVDAGSDWVDAGSDGVDAGSDGVDAGSDGVDAGSDGVDPVSDGDDPVSDGDDAGSAAVDRPRVEFDHVTFRYGPDEPHALRDVSFSIGAGETVALVGHSGSGKSTCVNLVLRFWDPEAGRVLVGGTDARALPQGRLHALVGLVPQDPYLFNATVRENVVLGRPDATDADLEKAAREAVAWEFLAALPDGVDTTTGESAAQLSGGQRQRLAIARALITDPPILVLDEPVSNLDSDNESALLQAMTQARAGRTTLIVAHRLSTIRAADRIVVLERGQVAATGTHTELLRDSEVYRRLVDAQLR